MKRGNRKLVKNRLAAAIVGVDTPYLTVLSGTTMINSPPSTAASTAVALDESSDEGSVGGDWPSRPEGVSDSVLLDAWLQLHTPKATVHLVKKKGNKVRPPYAKSGIHVPKATCLGFGNPAYKKGVHVTSEAGMRAKMDRSLQSRMAVGATANVSPFVTPKAEQYVLDCWAHRCSVVKDELDAIKAWSNAVHNKAPSHAEVVELHIIRKETEEDPSRYDTSGLLWETSCNDASVAMNDDFVGPLQPVYVSKDATNVYYPLDSTVVESMEAAASYHREVLQFQLERAFSGATDVVKKELESERKSVETFFSLRSKGVDNFSQKWVQDKRKQLSNYLNSVSSSAAEASSRWLQYRYKLQGLKRKVSSAYEPISQDKFWSLFRSGHSLPGEDFDNNTYFTEDREVYKAALKTAFHYYKKRRAELREAFASHVAVAPKVIVKKPDTPSDEALCRLYDRILAEAHAAKDCLKVQANAAKAQFNGQSFVQADSGIFIPAVMADVRRELALEPRF